MSDWAKTDESVVTSECPLRTRLISMTTFLALARNRQLIKLLVVQFKSQMYYP